MAIRGSQIEASPYLIAGDSLIDSFCTSAFLLSPWRSEHYACWGRISGGTLMRTTKLFFLNTRASRALFWRQDNQMFALRAKIWTTFVSSCRQARC